MRSLLVGALLLSSSLTIASEQSGGGLRVIQLDAQDFKKSLRDIQMGLDVIELKEHKDAEESLFTVKSATLRNIDVERDSNEYRVIPK